jgi:hypothetical protein
VARRGRHGDHGRRRGEAAEAGPRRGRARGDGG